LEENHGLVDNARKRTTVHASVELKVIYKYRKKPSIVEIKKMGKMSNNLNIFRFCISIC
jgi:hypothetical protein